MSIIKDNAGNPIHNGNPLPVMTLTQPSGWQYAIAAPAADTADKVIKAALAFNKNYMTGLQVINTGAVATEYVIKDGSTVIYRGYAPANMTAVDDTLFNTPLRSSTNAALNFACITTGASVYVNAQGYQAV
jgi:hypothetical protein